MTSNIDATKPASPNAYTADMRANFQAAADEISALQAAMDAPAPWLPLDGGTMVGPLTLAGDPVNALDAATMQYVDALVAGGPFLPLGGGVLTGDLTLGGTASRRSLIVDSGTGQSRIFLRSTAGSGQGNNSITFWDVTNNRGVGVYGGDYSGVPTIFMGMMSASGGATGVAALRVSASDVMVSGSFTVTNGYPIFGAVPVLPEHGANKAYVDAGDAARLPLTGGTLTPQADWTGTDIGRGLAIVAPNGISGLALGNADGTSFGLYTYPPDWAYIAFLPQLDDATSNPTNAMDFRLSNRTIQFWFDVIFRGRLSLWNIPTADPAVAGYLWVDPAADFALKVSQG